MTGAALKQVDLSGPFAHYYDSSVTGCVEQKSVTAAFLNTSIDKIPPTEKQPQKNLHTKKRSGYL